MPVVPATRHAQARPVLARRRLLVGAGAAACLGLCGAAARSPPVLLGLDAELGVEGSTSAQAIQAGIEIAIDEINAAGGVLGGRPLALVTRDNRTMPARAAQNLRELGAMPDLVGVFCGRYSPTVLETVPLVHELQLPLLDPWASADGIVEHGHDPSYTFRLAMADAWALPAMASHAARQGRRGIGFLAVNTSWGRSSERALLAHVAARGQGQRVTASRWFNYTDDASVISAKYLELLHSGAEAVVYIGNFREGSDLVRAIAALPAAERRPLMAHAGVMGGDFFGACGAAVAQVDVTVAQTFGFGQRNRPRERAVLAAARARLGPRLRQHSAAGLAQAYDLTHIAARAVDAARSTERPLLRTALERARPYAGLIRDYPAPFTRERHDALAPDNVYMARFDADGSLVRAR